MIYIAVLGHGVVGSGVVEVLDKSAASIAKKTGQELAVKRILDLRDFPDSPHRDKFTKNYADIVSDPEIRVVVEVMGGVHPAYDYAKAALEAGKSVVTSNKEMVAQKGAELLRVAARYNVNFLFEASVGGGIPIIRPLHQCLAANDITEIAGILNGTTNFILTKMYRENMSFDDALALASRLGYAEANPAADVEGLDACRKICILASLAFGSHVYPDKVPTTGITALTREDVQYAEAAGCVIKLIGQAHKTEDGKVYALVSSAFIPRDSQLAGVDDVYNGILVRGDATGDVVFYGKGAGKLPTASAVMSDVIDCVNAPGTIQSLTWADSDGSNLADYRQQQGVFYLRIDGASKAQMEREFGSISYLERGGRPAGELALLTAPLSEGALEGKLEKLAGEGAKVLACIRKLDF